MRSPRRRHHPLRASRPHGRHHPRAVLAWSAAACLCRDPMPAGRPEAGLAQGQWVSYYS